MSKKIVILNGSPRVGGNTAALIAAFKEGAESAGNTVNVFDLQKMNIHPCMGCGGGGKNPESPCVQKDDMQKIYPFYKEADVVVFASPLYYWTISGQLKCAIDRLYAVEECPEGRLKKEGILLIAAAGDGFEESVYWYERLMDHLGWKSLGKILAGGVWNAGDIEGKPELMEAKRLGASI